MSSAASETVTSAVKHLSAFDFQALLDCGHGKLFGPGNARLPLPPMLMFDRITHISDKGGANDKGQIVAELDVKPDPLVLQVPFRVRPRDARLPRPRRHVADGRLLLGLGRRKGPRPSRRRGEVKFSDMVLPDAKLITYVIDLKRVITRKLVLGIADGVMKIDGRVAYEAKDLRVLLAPDAPAAA